MSSDQTASSSSMSPIVKIGIDLNEYQRLKNLEGHLKSQEKKLSDQLHSSVYQKGGGEEEKLKAENNIESEQPKSEIKTEIEKDEPQNEPKPKSENFKEEIVNAVIDKLTSVFGLVLPDGVQKGSGPGDTVEPQQPLIENPSSNAPLLFTVENQKNNQTDPTSESLVLSKVPDSFREKAKLLLSAFDENPQQLTWNKKGEVYIEQDSIPKANFFQLFPALFKFSSVESQLPGYVEFVNQIALMGLAHLIHPKLLRGFRRKQKITNEKEIYKRVLRNDKWYYLGPV